MPLKGNVLLYALPLFFYILCRMLHPVFIVFVFIIFIWLFCICHKKAISVILVFIAFACIFRIPQEYKQTTIAGTVVNKDEQSITVKDGYNKILVYGNFEDVKMYDEIALEGKKYEILPPTNLYAFNYQNYLYSKNIFQVLTHTYTLTHTSKKHPYHYLEEKINKNEQLKSIVSLFILGIKDEGIEEEYKQLASLSLVHLFALSGMHISVLKKWLKSFLRYLMNDKWQDIVSLVLIGIYMMMIPYNISFLRAYLMMVLTLVFGKHFSKLDVFSFLTLAMLFYNPYLLFNMSFVFSYTIYFFMILLNGHKHTKYYIYLATIPIVLSMNYRLPLASIVTGVLLMPIVEYLYLAILYFLVLGNILGPIVQGLYGIMMMIVDFIAHYSSYLVFPKPNLMFIGVYYYLYIHVVYKVTLNRHAYKQLSCMLGLMIALYCMPYYNIKTQVTMIDVGQGDCCLIQQPFNQGNVLIDTGGMKNRDLAVETIIPYLYSQGIRRLDAIFISHDDFDHCGALESLQAHFNVKEVIYDFDIKKVGKLEFQNLSYKDYEESNDQSTVIYTTINQLHYLFTGDASSTVEEDLYERYKRLDVDVLKVGHHGSATSSSNALFKMIQPKIALIGVGRNNFYGHPHMSVINKLESYGLSVYRTDKHGMIRIIGYRGHNYIYTTLEERNE